MAPRFPILPIYEPILGRKPSDVVQSFSCILDVGQPIYLDSGSSAIGLALQCAGIRLSDEILVPAYHCPTMVTPVKCLGAKAVFYKINQDTSVSVDSIEELVSHRSKAILVPHFFGIAQEMSEIRALCDRYGIMLIEDCAHAFFGIVNGRPVGYFGDFAVASTRKFFPGTDGGFLISKKAHVNTEVIRSRSLIDEISALIDIIEEAFHYGKAPVWNVVLRPLLATKSFLSSLTRAARRRHQDKNNPDDSDDISFSLDIKGMSRASKYLLRNSDIDYVCRTRVDNFRHLGSRLQGVPGLHCLLDSINGDMVPYMYPLIVDNRRIYHALRDHDWPVWRWDDSDPSCEVSRYYSKHLLQLPCHQSLRVDDLDRLADAIIELNTNL